MGWFAVDGMVTSVFGLGTVPSLQFPGVFQSLLMVPFQVFAIAELHMSGAKNNRMVYIPDHLIVQDVENVMNDPLLHEGTEADQYIKKRADYSLDILIAYAAALKGMRESRNLVHKDYPFGM